MTLRTSQLLGAAVVDRQGRHLGRISDLLLDGPRPTSVSYALVEVAQHQGNETRTVAIPWSVLQPNGPTFPAPPLVAPCTKSTIWTASSLWTG